MSEVLDAIDHRPDWVMEQIRTNPGLAYLSAVTLSIKHLRAIAVDRKWQTLDDVLRDVVPLQTWAQFVNPDPGFVREGMSECLFSEFFLALNAACNVPGSKVSIDGLRPIVRDEKFGIPKAAQIAGICVATPSKALVWEPSRMDCDKGSRVMSGWLARWGLGNITVGVVTFTAYSGRKVLGSHVMLLGMDTEHRLWWIDPFYGRHALLQDISVTPFPTATSLVINELIL